MTVEPKQVPIPRWFVRSAWALHRGIYSISGGRRGLRTPSPGRYGLLRLKTIGRRTGKERFSILAYLEEGPDLLLMAMNGWADPAPAWYLNLRAHPEVVVVLPDETRAVTARIAEGDEGARVWARWVALDEDLEAYAASLSHETPVVILEPRSDQDQHTS